MQLTERLEVSTHSCFQSMSSIFAPLLVPAPSPSVFSVAAADPSILLASSPAGFGLPMLSKSSMTLELETERASSASPADPSSSSRDMLSASRSSADFGFALGWFRYSRCRPWYRPCCSERSMSSSREERPSECSTSSDMRWNMSASASNATPSVCVSISVVAGRGAEAPPWGAAGAPTPGPTPASFVLVCVVASLTSKRQPVAKVVATVRPTSMSTSDARSSTWMEPCVTFDDPLRPKMLMRREGSSSLLIPGIAAICASWMSQVVAMVATSRFGTGSQLTAFSFRASVSVCVCRSPKLSDVARRCSSSS
mmetsp:Transcript_19801/g.60014  ORF Transcript_19801/g.60014 Transcript_19801/m.60014 type:complete len:311 (-) Transcript_19801:1143-2075(-)